MLEGSANEIENRPGQQLQRGWAIISATARSNFSSSAAIASRSLLLRLSSGPPL